MMTPPTALPHVAVVTAPFDAHHERLFLGAFLRRLAARRLLTWSSGPYERCDARVLDGCQLLVLVRPRFAEVDSILDAAAARRLPVAVLIDDNWIAAGREYPRFEALFTPGRPAFETFLGALRRADVALVFNPVLAADLAAHARRVVELPPCIDLDAFPAAARPAQRGLVVGYAGSPRWESSGFAALASYADRHPEVRLFLMVHELPEPLREVDPARIDLVGWRHDYDEYTRILATAAPDILMAPLDSTRFTASKVPLKWFDATAVGAAGIYSRTPPYTDVVRHGETGLLVDNDPPAWIASLERLADDEGLRRRIAANALVEIRDRFDVQRVLPAFVALLASLLPGRFPPALS